MSKFRTGDRVFHKNRNNGTIVNINHNNLPMFKPDDNSSSTFESADHYLTLISNSTLNSEWQFHSASVDDIDWDLIAYDLSKKNPMALVERGDKRYVVIHTTLLEKADLVDFHMPIDGMPITAGETSYTNVFITEAQFSDWVEWAKDVKQAEWPNRDKQIVNIHIPRI